MKEFNEDFIKDTATMFADMQSDDIKLNYKDGVYYGYMKGFKKALELVKNNGVLDGVSVSFLYDFVNQFTDIEIPKKAIKETLDIFNVR